LCRLVTLSNA